MNDQEEDPDPHRDACDEFMRDRMAEGEPTPDHLATQPVLAPLPDSLT